MLGFGGGSPLSLAWAALTSGDAETAAAEAGRALGHLTTAR